MREPTGLDPAGCEQGRKIVYTAEHLSLAMLEYFVHLDAVDPPADLVVVAADIPRNVSRISVSLAELPGGWRTIPAPPQLTMIGDRFVNQGKYAILLVPSAIVSVEFNWLLNPAHRDFARITLRDTERFEYDSRFSR